MNSSSFVRKLVLVASGILLITAAAQAENAGVRFQRPGSSRAQSEQANRNFRRPGLESEAKPPAEARKAAAPKVARERKPAIKKQSAEKRVAAKQAVVLGAAEPVRKSKAVRQKKAVRRDPQVAVASVGPVEYDIEFPSRLRLASHGCATCDDACTCEAGCGCPEPSCGMYEPGCGIAEPSCGCGEPSCGIFEPSCGCGDVGCGSCVARPGPDYWCFPVCLPRFKDLSVFGGVQGFRGPRDFANGQSDSNFGFNEGFNLSGNALLVGLLFPQLSYQAGYRAVQSRLHGTATSTNDRSQQFVTAGLFRRVDCGIQFGAVWDYMDDDLDEDINLQQIRYEISLKSPQGREIGFFGTNSTDDALSSGTLYETVDQYAIFIRWVFGNGYEGRLWGGGTGDSEGLFGGEFYAPLTSRWALQSGFNYLITDQANGLAGVSEESWNIGINLVWHLGKTAKRGCKSPYRPMFSVADNGWMFVDQVQ